MGFWFLWITEQVVWPCFFNLYTSAGLSFQQLDISILICRTRNKTFGTRSLQMSICCLLVVPMLGFLLSRFVKKHDMDEYSINNVWVVSHSGSHTVLFVLLNSLSVMTDKWLLYTEGKSYGSYVTEGCSVEENQSRWAMIKKQEC